MLELYEDLDIDILQGVRLTMIYNVVVYNGGDIEDGEERAKSAWEMHIMSEVMSEY